MNAIKAIVRNGRIETDEPLDLPDGTELLFSEATGSADEDEPTPEEIARVLAAMERLQPLDIPPEVAADLDAWERRLNQRGIDDFEKGLESAFP